MLWAQQPVENWWTVAAGQVPSLCVLVFIIIVFLKFLNATAARQDRKDQHQNDALRTLGDNCHAFQRDLAQQNKEVFARVAQALDKNTEALGRNTESLVQAHRHEGQA